MNKQKQKITTVDLALIMNKDPEGFVIKDNGECFQRIGGSILGGWEPIGKGYVEITEAEGQFTRTIWFKPIKPVETINVNLIIKHEK